MSSIPVPGASPIVTAKVIDPSIDSEKAQFYAVLEGPQTVGWKPMPASSVSNSAINITAPMPDQTFIDRRVFLQVETTINFQGSVPGGGVTLLNLGISDSLRAMPLVSVLNSIAMEFWSAQVSMNQPYVVWPALYRYNNDRENRDIDLSGQPMMLDQFQEYSEGLGTNRNPMASYGTNTFEDPRGAFQFVSVTNPAYADPSETATASVQVVLTMPIMLPPFLWNRKEEGMGFWDVDTFSLTTTFTNTLARMWSRFNIPGGSTLDPTNPSAVVPTFDRARLLFRILAKSPRVMMPSTLNYAHFGITNYSNNVATLAPGASQEVQSNSIIVSGVPRRMYCWCAEQVADQTFLTSDTYARIETMQVLWNEEVVLSAATPHDVYRIAAKNNTNISWPQWRKFLGGVICIDFAQDIGLKRIQSAGSLGKQLFQVILTIRNVNTLRTIRYQMNVVCIQEGFLTVTGQTGQIYLNPISEANVLNSKSTPSLSFKKAESVYGGDFFSDLVSGIKKGVSTVANVVEKALPIAKTVASFVPGVGPLAQQALGIAEQALPYARALGGRSPYARHAARPAGTASRRLGLEDVYAGRRPQARRGAVRGISSLMGRGLEPQDQTEFEETPRPAPRKQRQERLEYLAAPVSRIGGIASERSTMPGQRHGVHFADEEGIGLLEDERGLSAASQADDDSHPSRAYTAEEAEAEADYYDEAEAAGEPAAGDEEDADLADLLESHARA